MQSVGIAILVLLATLSAEGQSQTEPERLKFCDVVASPLDYDGKLLSVEVTVQPGLHSLSLYSSECASNEDFDVTTQAILPDGWESLPNGKKLSRIISHGAVQPKYNSLAPLGAVFRADKMDSGSASRFQG